MIETNKFCWNELNAKDAAACKKFYGAVFGWTAHDEPAGPMIYTHFKKDGVDVCGMLQMTAEWGPTKPRWVPYIAVDDCDAYVKKITDNGGSVYMPPTDISVGRFACVTDPEGSVFCVIKLKE
jgi:predicted enzyme related to lactoylglutathione lyase